MRVAHTQPRAPRTGLMIAPTPGATVEVIGRLVGRPLEAVVVGRCVRAATWLAYCPQSGRPWAVLHPTDLLEVQVGDARFRVPAGMTAMPPAPSALVMVCGPPAGL